MGRTKQYERTDLLDKAVELFRRQGFNGTSTAELVAELGVNRKSMYAEFGSKQELFEATLEHYNRHHLTRVLGPIEAPEAGPTDYAGFAAQPTACGAEAPPAPREVTFEEPEVGITVVASGGALAAARMLIEELDEEEIDDRPIRYTFDDAVDIPPNIRVDRALSNEQYVWVISELDAAEGKIELRSNDPNMAGRGLTPDDALDLIEDFAPEVHYRGHWYFVFEGGCITYEFDASGRLAETVAADADDALGFYPAFELREIGREAGFDLGPSETDGD